MSARLLDSKNNATRQNSRKDAKVLSALSAGALINKYRNIDLSACLSATCPRLSASGLFKAKIDFADRCGQAADRRADRHKYLIKIDKRHADSADRRFASFTLLRAVAFYFLSPKVCGGLAQ